MATIFTKIIKGEIPCYKIAEDENILHFSISILLRAGHTLVVPKKETDYIFDLDDDQLAGLSFSQKRLLQQLKSAIPCNRIGIAILGLEVPHAHIHLVPMDTMEDVNFKNPKLKFHSEEFKDIASK